MKKKELQKLLVDRFVINDPLGDGGNAIVYEAIQKIDNFKVALKVLDSSVDNFDEKRERFIIETQKVKEIQDDIKGIIPIIDFKLPDDSNQNLYWYTMPIATPIKKHFYDEKSIFKIVQCIISLAHVLLKLHFENIVHRDIKPSNIYFFNGSYCLADFGLVDYPEKEDLTKYGEQIGAKTTIAPEMKKDAKHADGKKADIYSLAKTLWMLLTNNKYGFDGIYNPKSKGMGLRYKLKDEHIIELDQLLFDATQDVPDLRPSMEEFIDILMEWSKIYKNFELSNLSQWRYIQGQLFQKAIPNSANWREKATLTQVLNLLAFMPSLNHMFIPDGGGQDLSGAEFAIEEGCIEMRVSDTVYILKPKVLIFENIENDFLWNYFWLELDEISAYEETSDDQFSELVTEYLPGKYISWIYGNYGYYEDENPLPSNYRLVFRYLKGKFVFFSKTSIYNSINGTYDARHNKMSSDEFRSYIENMRKDYLRMYKEIFFDKYNPDPFRPKINEEDERKEFEKECELKKRFLEFVKLKYKNWNFYDFCEKYSVKREGLIAYSINIDFSDYEFSILTKDKYINLKGIIQDAADESIGNEFHEDAFRFFDFGEAIKVICAIKEFIQNECVENGIEWSDEIYFHTILRRVKPPKHIFSKEEIYNVLRNGNDHKNNVLAINENGYALLIEDPKSNQKRQYPVIHEQYNAYNNYVGQYSSLNHLDDEYISSLEGWLLHLQSKKQIVVQFTKNNLSKKELLEEIIKFY